MQWTIPAVLLVFVSFYAARILLVKQCLLEGIDQKVGFYKGVVCSVPFGFIENREAAQTLPSLRLKYIAGLYILGFLEIAYVVETALRWLPVPRLFSGIIVLAVTLVAFRFLERATRSMVSQEKAKK